VLVPGTEEVLAELAAAGIVMGVATNDATEAAAAAIAALGLDAYLPHVFGYDSVRHPKPAPDIVLASAAVTGVDPSDIAVVGDNRFDMDMARAAGAGAAVGVLTGNSGEDDLRPYADVVLPSIRDLPGWLAERKETVIADPTET
jgi:phosphoglycolate phosphatase